MITGRAWGKYTLCWTNLPRSTIIECVDFQWVFIVWQFWTGKMKNLKLNVTWLKRLRSQYLSTYQFMSQIGLRPNQTIVAWMSLINVRHPYYTQSVQRCYSASSLYKNRVGGPTQHRINGMTTRIDVRLPSASLKEKTHTCELILWSVIANRRVRKAVMKGRKWTKYSNILI